MHRQCAQLPVPTISTGVNKCNNNDNLPLSVVDSGRMVACMLLPRAAGTNAPFVSPTYSPTDHPFIQVVSIVVKLSFCFDASDMIDWPTMLL